ncbi:MAG: hypothetical protein PUC99_08700 [Eubacteriales bacterium]|nr:hypothetical protein [Eubacteriales bacterium]
MKVVTINRLLLQKFQQDPEVLRKTARPCVLVVRLKYKGHKRSFAIPMRSNISARTPRNQYFALPTRSTTRPGNHHGLHYIKMFPVTKKYLIRYRIEGNAFAMTVQSVIDKHESQIIKECQQYLDAYESGCRIPFSTDLDLLISILDSLS